MLLWVSEQLGQIDPNFYVFRYMTLRSVLAALVGLVGALVIGHWVLRLMERLQIGENIRSVGPESHKGKQGTPTMGGIVIVAALLVSLALWADWSNMYIQLLVLATLGFAAIGFRDDWLKSIKKHPDGMSARSKILWQSAMAVLIASVLYNTAITPQQTEYLLPLFKEVSLDFGVGYVFVTWFVLVGTSNAVNLTDGLDGLAAMPSAMIAAALGVIAHITGNVDFAEYILVPYLEGTSEITVFAAALVGAVLGFLWFNAYPAQIFMGDVGSLMLGGVLGTMAVMLRHEVVFALMSVLFAVEAISVILQVGSYKLRGRRIFRMAPLHHHFEEMGIPESRIIIRSWILTIICILAAMSTLKLR